MSDFSVRLLARIGLVPRQRYERVRVALGESQTDVRRLEKTVRELRKNFDLAKVKAHEAVLRAKRAEHIARRLTNAAAKGEEAD